MKRRRFLAGLTVAPWLFPRALPAVEFAPVTPGVALRFPEDHGAHPAFRTEWWYATGWLRLPDGRPLGFQITFFRVRTGIGESNPSRFAPRQLILAHAAIADPQFGRLRHAERAGRAGFGRADFSTETTGVMLDDWSLRIEGGRYLARVRGTDFSYALDLVPAGPPLPNGRDGFSMKGPDPRHASFYYSRPQMRASGQLVLDGRQQPVSGHAWLDHEWSSELLPDEAQGWDWVGINFDDGGSLMAFRLRDHRGRPLWASASWKTAGGAVRIFGPGEIAFSPRRQWRSPRTGIEYPVAWRLAVDGRELMLEPLFEDQELDSRRSTGAIYWEGAARLFESGRAVGEGYLEMTGYGERIAVGQRESLTNDSQKRASIAHVSRASKAEPN